MSINHQSDDACVADFANKSEAVIIGEEKGDGSENLHSRKKWQSNVTIVSCVSIAVPKTEDQVFIDVLANVPTSISQTSVTGFRTVWRIRPMLFSRNYLGRAAILPT
jgi:hypothetical protein